MMIRRIILPVAGFLLATALSLPAQTPMPPISTTATTNSGVADSTKPKSDLKQGRDSQRMQPGAVEIWLKGLKERNPEEFERLSKLRTEDPAAFQKELRERLQKMRDGGAKLHDEIVRRYPELLKQDQETHKLIESYKAASPDDKKQIRAELKKKLGEFFELREKARQETIQHLESQLGQLKKDAERRKANRDAIIDRRLKELTENDPLAL